MNDTVKVICENSDSELHVNLGTSLVDVLEMLSLKNSIPFIASYVNNKFMELDYKIYKPISVRFIDITHFEGMRVYQRTLFFTLSKAIKDLYPDNGLRIRHSVSRGFYCEIEGKPDITTAEVEQIKERVTELVKQDIPIVRQTVLGVEAEEIYRKMGADDKVALLNTRPKLYVTIYRLANMVGNLYGALAISTRYLHLFDIRKYYKGFYVVIPVRTEPTKLDNMVRQEKMFDIFNEYKAWVDVMEVSNIGSLNQRVIEGKGSELIKVAEAFHEKKLGSIADDIAKANKSRGARVVLISGPSSSGKTTFAKRLGIQLRILGLTPVLVSLDDYFVDRDKTPLDEKGNLDFESLNSLDLISFNHHIKRLLAGESVDVPRYDFITGKRETHEKPLVLNDSSLLVIEGIHGLNPELTQSVEDSDKYKIYISALTSISMDHITRIATTDNRLLRRIVRDYYNRGSNATKTLGMWGSVRRGEERHIFPYQENADVMFNSSLFYEISILRRYVEPLLHEVPDTVPEYAEATRLMNFLDNFIPLPPDEIPPTSILREFVGGSSFVY